MPHIGNGVYRGPSTETKPLTNITPNSIWIEANDDNSCVIYRWDSVGVAWVPIISISKTETLSNKTLTNPIMNGETRASSTKTGAYTLLNTDRHIRADATTAGFTLTLPTAAGIAGKPFKIKKIDSTNNVVIIDGNGAQTIEGMLTWELRNQFDFVEVISDGANWNVVDFNTPTIHSFRRKGVTEDRWYIGGMIVGSALSTSTLTPDNLNATPFIVSSPMTLNDLAVNVTTSAASSSVRLGVYTDVNLYPSALVVDAGTVATATDNTFAIVTLATPVKLQPGLYWLVAVSGTGSPTVRGITTSHSSNILGYRSTAADTVAQISWVHAFTFGALPATFPNTAPATSTANRVAIYARFVV